MSKETKLLLAATAVGVVLGALGAGFYPKAWATIGSSTSATTEVLVLNSAPVALPQTQSTKGRKAMEIYNNGPNTIWCAFSSATAVLTKARPVAASSSWALDAPTNVIVYCRAATADQVTGAATVVSELFDD